MRTRLLARERVALHRAIAAALERDNDGRSHDVDDALAYHTFEAGDWDAARRYALRAAGHASTLSAPREALQQLENALVATRNAGLAPDAALLTARGRAHETLGAFPQAQQDFAAALELARTTADARAEWDALHALGLLWAARDYDRAGEYRHHALAVARALGDQALLARSLNRVGNWYVNREDPQQGMPYHNEALAIAERLGDPRGVAETVDLLAMSNHIAGRQDAAVALFDRAVTLFDALDDKRGLSNALSVIVSCSPTYHSSAGPVCASVHMAEQRANERSVRLASEIGWRAGESFSRLLLADSVAWCGDYGCGARRVVGVIAQDLAALDDALAQLGAAHAIARRLGSTTWIRWTGAPFGIALVRAGQLDRATAVLDDVDRTVPHAAPADSADGVTRTLGTRFLALARAELAFARGAYAEVLARVELLDEMRAPRVALLKARALSALERWSDAAASLQIARDGAETQGARSLIWRIDAAWGAVHLGERRRVEARRSFDAARAAAAELMSSVDDAALMTTFRAEIDRVAPAPPEQSAGPATKAAFGGLTRRERDTAALIAQGKSNRAIARALGIGERTVESYVAASLSKLGFSSRAQIAVWAAEHGIAATEAGAGRTRR
jgi:DNA-binding CsgD family transcriptional regulator